MKTGKVVVSSTVTTGVALLPGSSTSYGVEFIQPTWGRNSNANLLMNNVVLLFLFLFSPLLTFSCYISCAYFDCSLSTMLWMMVKEMSLTDFITMIPLPTYTAVYVFVIWYVLQVVLYLYLPGNIGRGQNTPAGHVLDYNVNGLRAWVISHTLFGLCCYCNVFSPTIIWENWGGLLAVANIWGFVLSNFCYVKALYAPTYPRDSKQTGNLLFDYFLGIELNPRIGNLDFKLFFNGRPGIGGWNLVNLSFMAAQYHNHGEITNSMYLLTFLHMLYILDFFWHEEWYLSTIDIHHDHFGWYLAWGDSVWLPFMYTLQGLYLTIHPYRMATWEFYAVLGIGLIGYLIFRWANYQKTYFRKTPRDKCIIWGKPATYIHATYTTSDGKTHESNLLTSGFWGLSRHFNYFGDLLISFAYCACCGYSHILPHFYIIYMTVLLVGRVERDNSRLKEKYGEKWKQYCSIVRWKILPFVY